MPTVDELLNNTIESQICTIDPDTRVINVPACYKEFGVEADEKVNRIKFQCPKIVGDNIDLTTFNLYINYMNARGYYNAYLVDDVTVFGDNIMFSWLLSRHVTEKSGTVNYIVCAKKSDDTSVLNEWNTKVATATVGIGLEATTVVEEQNADVIEQILIKLNSSQVQADYAQNDLNAKDYIKNRPFYGKKGTRLRNTYEDWAAAGGDDGSGAKPILSFIINDEIYENITPNVYNSGYTKVYNIPSVEQPKYQVVAYTQNRRIICTLRGSSKEIENWSIYPPEETEEIHYLDSKYLDPGILARIEKLESGALTVHVTDNNGTLQASKSYIEIMDAILAGTTVLVEYGIGILPLIVIINHNLFFGTTLCNNDGTEATVSTSIIQITKNNEVLNLSTQFNIPSAVTDDHINSLIDTKLGVIENGSY